MRSYHSRPGANVIKLLTVVIYDCS